MITIACDGVTFLHPARIGGEAPVYFAIVATGRTSLKLALEPWCRLHVGTASQCVTRAAFTSWRLARIVGRPRCPISATGQRETRSLDNLIRLGTAGGAG